MKARVKATGEIVEVSDTTTIYPEHYNKSYNITEVEFLDVKEKSFPKDDDYWTRLEHQYAGMAMQAYIIVSHISQFSFCECDKDMRDCKNMAHALVEKMKEAK